MLYTCCTHVVWTGDLSKLHTLLFFALRDCSGQEELEHLVACMLHVALVAFRCLDGCKVGALAPNVFDVVLVDALGPLDVLEIDLSS